ncbi:MAG TPA: sugar kinase [Burkholderiales bacterium]|jgi:2-dehydro-3-deoxygluconokinase|nr:sugar kinase [Burkholderiales bacterium]
MDIVSLGEPLYEFSQIPGESGRYLQGFGGDTMNCAIAAARQGAKAGYITRLGDDEFGRQFLQLWRAEGLDISGVGIDPQAHTAVYFISHGADGHVFSYLRQGSAASRIRPADLPLELIRDATFFHTSGISQAISDTACDTVFAAIEAARGAGVRIAYDSNLRLRLWPLARARAVIRATIALADYFLLSMEDAEALCGERDADAILDWCHEAGAKVVALKLGAAGVVGSDSKRREKLAGHAVNCVDATGAGDCFAGALLARMAVGDDFWEGLRYANAAAALATTGFGAVAPLPRPDAVRRLLSGFASQGRR